MERITTLDYRKLLKGVSTFERKYSADTSSEQIYAYFMALN